MEISPFLHKDSKPINQEEYYEQALLENISKFPSLDEKIVLAEQISTESLESVESIFDKASPYIKSILSAVIFACATQASAGQKTELISPVEEDISYLTFLKQKGDIREITGIDFHIEAKKINRTAKLYTPEKISKLTIVHLGQEHVSSLKTNFKHRDSIIKSQEEISQLLTSSPLFQTKVFVEGYTNEETSLTIQNREIFKKMGAAESLNSIKDIYGSFWKDETPDHADTAVAILNAATGQALVKLGFTETSPLTYEKNNETMSLQSTGFLPSENAYTESNQRESKLAGASALLDAEGMITIEPAETVEGNNAVFNFMPILKRKGEYLHKILTSTLGNESIDDGGNNIIKNLYSISFNSSELIQTVAESDVCRKNTECQTLVEEILNKDIPKIQKAVFEDREDIAVELIAKSITSDQKVFPLVYGKKHDFTRAVARWNQKHPEMEFNLVTIK